MTNETIAAFLAVLPEKRRERAATHLANVTVERVFNADYTEAKFYLGRGVDEAWAAVKEVIKVAKKLVHEKVTYYQKLVEGL